MCDTYLSPQNPGPSRGKERIRNPDSWKKNVAKRLRNRGLEYVSPWTGQHVPARVMGPPCSDGCYDRITLPVATLIHEHFWEKGDFALQNAYIQKHVAKMPVKRRRRLQDPQGPRRRTCTFQYTLSYNNTGYNVCKKGFLSILAISDKRVETALNSANATTNTTTDDEDRNVGGQEQQVLDYMGSFPPVTSDYIRAISPHLRYLQDELADTSSAETSDVKTEDETNTALPTISAVQGKAEEIEVKVEVFEEQLQEDVFDNPQQAISFVDVAEQRVKDEQDDQPDLAKSHISPEPQNLEHFVKCLSTEDHSEANCKDPLDNLGTPFTEHSLHVQSPAVTAFPFRHDQPGSTYVKHLHMGMGTQNTLSDVIMSETKSKNVGAKKKPSKSTESQNPDAVFLEYVKVYLSKMNERQKNKAKIGIMELLHKCAEEA